MRARFSRLLPLAPLPPELREQVLNLSTSTADDAVAYRRRVARHAEWIRFARFSQAIRQVSWSGIRAHPGVAIAAAAVVVWVVAAVSVTLLTFVGSRAVVVEGVRHKRAAWVYEAPKPKKEAIRDRCGKIADERGEIADQEGHLVAELLELAHLVEQHRVPEMQIRRGRVESRLHLERTAAPQLLLKLRSRQHFAGATLELGDLLVEIHRKS